MILIWFDIIEMEFILLNLEVKDFLFFMGLNFELLWSKEKWNDEIMEVNIFVFIVIVLFILVFIVFLFIIYVKIVS